MIRSACKHIDFKSATFRFQLFSQPAFFSPRRNVWKRIPRSHRGRVPHGVFIRVRAVLCTFGVPASCRWTTCWGYSPRVNDWEWIPRSSAASSSGFRGTWRPCEMRVCARRRGFGGTTRPCAARGWARRRGYRSTVRPCETHGCARRRRFSCRFETL